MICEFYIRRLASVVEGLEKGEVEFILKFLISLVLQQRLIDLITAIVLAPLLVDELLVLIEGSEDVEILLLQGKVLGLLLFELELLEPLLLIPLDVLHAVPHLLGDHYLDEEVGLPWVDGVILFRYLE
jgi:hypothetical protein